MKRIVLFLCLALSLAFCFFALSALAEEMHDITSRCGISAESRMDPASNLTDGKKATRFRWNKSTTIFVNPRNETVHGLYLKWNGAPGPWQVRVLRGAVWETAYTGGGKGIYHEFLPMDGISETFQILSASDEVLPPLMQLIVLGAGQIPGWAQTWEPTPEKAELMVIAAHSDDELLFFGGVLPLYAGVQRRDTAVVYMCADEATRLHEALDGLWACGVRQHPVFGPFKDYRTDTLAEAYTRWGMEKSRAFVSAALRRYKPDVVISHDLYGEYGHGAHRLTGNVTLDCVINGNDPGFQPESYEVWGGWQPLKCYLHLYKENRIEMDFDEPLEAFDGRTGRKVADDAFLNHHKSQGKVVFRASDRGKYDCAVWGLAFTQVGNDAAKNDFFENVSRHRVREPQRTEALDVTKPAVIKIVAEPTQALEIPNEEEAPESEEMVVIF